MKNLRVLKHRLALVVIMCTSTVLFGQKKYTETFNASDDVTVKVNTTYTNVIFETWNKDKIEVEAFIDGDDLRRDDYLRIEDRFYHNNVVLLILSVDCVMVVVVVVVANKRS